MFLNALSFERWDGAPVKETFGGKPIISVDGKPIFAEKATMTYFFKAGWQSRWMETYGRSSKFPLCISEGKDDKYSN